MKRTAPLTVLVLASLLLAAPAVAAMPDEQLADTALETRAVGISRQLRCVVCQNQSIDDSSAPLARDMRIIVRERLVAGDSDEEVKGYLVSRYGNYVLLRPPVQANTWALWFAPLGMFGLAWFGIFAFARSRRTRPRASPLTESERTRLSALVDHTNGSRRL